MTVPQMQEVSLASYGRGHISLFRIECSLVRCDRARVEERGGGGGGNHVGNMKKSMRKKAPLALVLPSRSRAPLVLKHRASRC